MTIFSECAHFSYIHDVWYKLHNELQYFRKNYPEVTSPAPEMLFLMIFDNFILSIFNQPKKHFLVVSSTTDTLLKNQIFVEVFLKESYEYPLLRKELAIALFVELYKTVTLVKSYLKILSVLETICWSIAFILTFCW